MISTYCCTVSCWHSTNLFFRECLNIVELYRICDVGVMETLARFERL